MSDVITIANLSVSYHQQEGTPFHALANVSMLAKKGQIVGIVGESGAGKSTIGKAILGLLRENAQVESGTMLLSGQDIAGLNEADYFPIRGNRVGYIYQNPMTALDPVLTIGEQLIEAIEANAEIHGSAATDYAIDLLQQAEIPQAADCLRKYPHQLSGGMCQRVVFAIAIAAKPELIIADEPTTALDVTVQKSVLLTLKNLALKHAITIILITHDMGVIAETCDYIYVMRNGEVVEHERQEVLMRAPKKDYTRELLASIPRIDRKMDRFPVPALSDVRERTRALDFLIQRQDGIEVPDDQPLLSVRHLSKTFVTPATIFNREMVSTALQDVNFDVYPGEILGIVGESGSGKSTVGRIILGLHEPDIGGEVIYKGRTVTGPVSSPERQAHCRSMQCIFQEPYASLNPRMSAGENITYALRAKGLMGRRAAHQLAGDLMELVGLPRPATNKMPHAFSGGEMQRIGIARALSFRPDFLFCDEPTSALDMTVQAELLNLMKDLQSELGLTMLFVSHNLAVVRQMCDRVLVMRSGQVIEDGPCDEVLVSPSAQYTQSLLAAMPRFVPEFT